MTISFKATINHGDKSITFEGPREFVEEQVALYTSKTSKPPGEIRGNDTYEQVSPRALMDEKKPRGHHETVAVLAFALHKLGIDEFTEDDVRRAYIQAGARPPKVVGQALRDSKNKFDYIEAGKKRGTYKLSHHGDRTVRFDLPR
jgi:hypothetical protein